MNATTTAAFPDSDEAITAIVIFFVCCVIFFIVFSIALFYKCDRDGRCFAFWTLAKLKFVQRFCGEAELLAQHEEIRDLL